MAGFKATPITDNYHYGMLGEFKVIIHSDTNYLNITKLCTDGGRNFYKWKECKGSKETLKFFDENYLKNDPPFSHGHSSEYKCLYEIKNGNLLDVYDQKTQGLLQGSYCHSELAITYILPWINKTNIKGIKNKNGLIYIVTNDIYKEHNLYKIGLTKDMTQRLKGLQTASPIPMKAIFTKKFNDVETIEETIHKHYHTVRKEGE